jgi:hypothetical protein
LRAQQVELRFHLHALRDHGHAQRMRHGDDGGGKGQVVGIPLHVGHEAAVDLDPVHRHAAQMAQTGEAGAEIVQPHLHAGAVQPGQQRAGLGLIADDRGLGQLQVQARGRQAGFAQGIGHHLRQVAGAQLSRRNVTDTNSGSCPSAGCPIPPLRRMRRGAPADRVSRSSRSVRPRR